MTIRTEVEKKLASLNIPIAYENVSFTRPTGEWLEVFFLTPNKLLSNVAADGYREYGMFQVNVHTKLGTGSGRATELVNMIKNLFPVLPKTGSFSVESPPNEAKGFPDGEHWCVPITVRYRAEF